MNPISLTILIYLGIGLTLAGLSFAAVAALRKIGQPNREVERAFESQGWVVLFVGLVIAWPAAVVVWAKRGDR